MATAPTPFRDRFTGTGLRARPLWLAALVLLAAAVAAASAYVYSRATATSEPVLSGFAHRSYRPGQVAVLQIGGGGLPARAKLQVFLAGASGGDAPVAPKPGWDKYTFGEAVTTATRVSRPAGGAWNVPIRLGANWPSGDYVARLSWRGGHSDYAPFVLRPKKLGTASVLVIEPTNTWHAYNALDGDSWYMNSNVHVIDLTHPWTDHTVKGQPTPDGLPKQFQVLDCGFLRWYWKSGYRADFFSDDDLEKIKNVQQLLRYKLIVFGGHEEYVTGHVYKLMTEFRDAGHNLAFLSANNFFYKVEVHGDTMVGRTRWRDLGKPEASLVGAQYVGWNESNWPNRPYHIINREAAPWLFKGTGLKDGATFGNYGIEIDEPNTVSPDDTEVLAEIPHEFGKKAADMTIYTMGHATVFDAGVFNFGASAHWGGISRMVSNLWSHLSGQRPHA